MGRPSRLDRARAAAAQLTRARSFLSFSLWQVAPTPVLRHRRLAESQQRGTARTAAGPRAPPAPSHYKTPSAPPLTLALSIPPSRRRRRSLLLPLAVSLTPSEPVHGRDFSSMAPPL